MKKIEQTLRRRTLPRRPGSLPLSIGLLVAISGIPVTFPLADNEAETQAAGDRSHGYEALKIAEAGLDHATALLNSGNDTGWTVTWNEAHFSSGNMQLGDGATGVLEVLVEDRSGEAMVTSEGRVTSETGHTASRQLTMSVPRPFHLARGLVARCEIEFEGGISYIESYRSSQGGIDSPEYERRDGGFVALASPESFSIGNGNIWGYVATGGGEVSAGPYGAVQGENSPEFPRVDRDRVAMDFQAAFPRPQPAPAPWPDGPAIERVHLQDWIDEQQWDHNDGVARSLDHYIDSANKERIPGSYIVNYGVIDSSTTLGIPAGLRVRDDGGSHPDFAGRMIVYAEGIAMNDSSDILRIIGPVVLVVTGDASLDNGARLAIGYDNTNVEEAGLLLYANGDIQVAGSGGMQNHTRRPVNLTILGTAPEHDSDCQPTQTFALGGDAPWEAIVYGLNADITLGGGGGSGAMAGAVTGMNITITGGSRFHCDEDASTVFRP